MKRVIIISSFVVICFSAVLASATQTSVEAMYRDITSVDALITMQNVVVNVILRTDINRNGRLTSLDA